MFEQFKSKLSIDDNTWNGYLSHFNQIDIPAKTLLLKEGEISKKLFLVDKGCIRVWYNNNGNDITLQFFFENNVVASIESFRKNIPSFVNIETIEPSTLWWIHKKDMDKIIEEIKTIPPLRDMFINAIFERTYDYMKHFFSAIKDSPAERYLQLLEKKPEIIKRVPQHYIASYLGISTVHLSRIKGKIAKKKDD